MICSDSANWVRCAASGVGALHRNYRDRQTEANRLAGYVVTEFGREAVSSGQG